MSVWDVFNHFTVDVFRELYRSLCPTGWAHPSALAGESDKKGVLASVAIHPCGSVSEDAAI
jgi:hypothetical protein